MAIQQEYAGPASTPRGNGSNTPGASSLAPAAAGDAPLAGTEQAGAASGSGGSVPGQVRQTLGKAKDRLADTMIAAQDRSSEMVSRASGYVQRYPFSMLATALGVGVVIGWLLASSEIQRSSWLPRHLGPRRHLW